MVMTLPTSHESQSATNVISLYQNVTITQRRVKVLPLNVLRRTSDHILNLLIQIALCSIIVRCRCKFTDGDSEITVHTYDEVITKTRWQTFLDHPVWAGDFFSVHHSAPFICM